MEQQIPTNNNKYKITFTISQSKKQQLMLKKLIIITIRIMKIIVYAYRNYNCYYLKWNK